MRAMAVVMINEHRQRSLEMLTISSQSKHSDRTVRTKRSAIPFASGT